MKHAFFLGGLVCAGTLLGGCPDYSAQLEIPIAVEPGQQDQRKPRAMSAPERLGLTGQATMVPGPGAGTGARAFHYQVPPTWEELPPAQFRDVNLRVQGQPDSEIYLTVLAGGGGGLGQNINRWRGQMGSPAYSDEEIAALPRQSFMNQQGTFVEVAGTFTGMGNIPAQPDFKLLGLALVTPEQGYFLKMTGPAAVVDAEKENFLSFAKSLHANTPGHSHGPAAAEAPQDHDHEHDHEHTHDHEHAEHEQEHVHEPGETSGAPAASAAPAAPAAIGTASLNWTAPEGWVLGAESPMRVVTFKIPGAEDAECYVSSLRGAGGGPEANLSRWRQQMGQPPLTPEEFAALPAITVLGQEVKLLQVEGDFTGLDKVTRSNQMMLGVVVPAAEETIFIKMTGPAPVITPQVAAFQAFCASLH